YAADEASFGKKTVADLPVDQHELIALCAPRLCFISYGVVPGDPNWVELLAVVWISGPSFPTAFGQKSGAGEVVPAADRPVPRTDANSKLAHQLLVELVENLKKGRIDVDFAGDSITCRWRATDYPQFLANWNENFFGRNAANFGWGATPSRISCSAYSMA